MVHAAPLPLVLPLTVERQSCIQVSLYHFNVYISVHIKINLDLLVFDVKLQSHHSHVQVCLV